MSNNNDSGSLTDKMGIANPLGQRLNMFTTLFRQGRIGWKLLFDPRVSITSKLIPILTLAYILSPLDFLPELFVGPVGIIDDLTLIVFALNLFIQTSPNEVVEEYALEFGYIDESPPQLASGDE